VKRLNQPRSLESIRREPPDARTQRSTTIPAGNRRRLATSQGPPVGISGAIAVIAVPHNAKGSTISSQRAEVGIGMGG
jgi:hypothetical protein